MCGFRPLLRPTIPVLETDAASFSETVVWQAWRLHFVIWGPCGAPGALGDTRKCTLWSRLGICRVWVWDRHEWFSGALGQHGHLFSCLLAFIFVHFVFWICIWTLGVTSPSIWLSEGFVATVLISACSFCTFGRLFEKLS